jgi:hypothetical protein
VLHALIVIAVSLLVVDVAIWEIRMKLTGENGIDSDAGRRHGGGHRGS